MVEIVTRCNTTYTNIDYDGLKTEPFGFHFLSCGLKIEILCTLRYVMSIDIIITNKLIFRKLL